jgi:hypothetical protein
LAGTASGAEVFEEVFFSGDVFAEAVSILGGILFAAAALRGEVLVGAVWADGGVFLP